MIMTTDCGPVMLLLSHVFCLFFFQNKGDFSVQILLIDDEPQTFLHGGGGPQVGEVTRLSI